jgi:hypothetical protein
MGPRRECSPSKRCYPIMKMGLRKRHFLGDKWDQKKYELGEKMCP